jgi:hypothetical protein
LHGKIASAIRLQEKLSSSSDYHTGTFRGRFLPDHGAMTWTNHYHQTGFLLTRNAQSTQKACKTICRVWIYHRPWCTIVISFRI